LNIVLAIGVTSLFADCVLIVRSVYCLVCSIIIIIIIIIIITYLFDKKS